MKPDFLYDKVLTIDEAIFVKQERQFIHSLQYSQQLVESNTVSTLIEAWHKLPLTVQKKVKKQYLTEMSILSAILLDGKTGASQLVDFLLENDFGFTKGDIQVLKKNHWLHYRPCTVQCRVYEVNMWLPLKRCRDTVKDWLGIEDKPLLYIVDYFPHSMRDTLAKHYYKLPKKLQVKLLQELPVENLIDMSANSFNFYC